jgi:hypothetical protein
MIWKVSGVTRHGCVPPGYAEASRKNPKPIKARKEKQFLWSLGGNFRGSLHHFFHDLQEFIEPSGRDNDIITTAIDVLRDAQKAAARVFFKGKDKRLAFDLNFFRF